MPIIKWYGESNLLDSNGCLVSQGIVSQDKYAYTEEDKKEFDKTWKTRAPLAGFLVKGLTIRNLGDKVFDEAFADDSLIHDPFVHRRYLTNIELLPHEYLAAPPGYKFHNKLPDNYVTLVVEGMYYNGLNIRDFQETGKGENTYTLSANNTVHLERIIRLLGFVYTAFHAKLLSWMDNGKTRVYLDYFRDFPPQPVTQEFLEWAEELVLVQEGLL